ncbi:DUF222 domain-containing protein [Nocardia sp. ET3-3]|uniref:DUF222 domain-containing protein n=1 Tax=Nocardia terrae TaxID=2675851 RepID=A0A7K1UPS1_9NOCA|nr:HNH endonuclease signature motif containing protein [Nocardia terrae]MVU76324.1 DUF222 domain-containing protein [Nocardia terrae]
MTRGGETFESVTIAEAIAAMSKATDTLLGDCLDSLSDQDFVAAMQEWETAKRRMAAVDHLVVGQVKARNLPEKAGWRAQHTAKYLQQTLRLSNGEARARVGAAEWFGPRQEAGQILEPELAWTAAVQEQGLISSDHTRTIGKIMARIPAKVDPVQRFRAEAHLAVAATTLTPDQLPTIGDRILGYLDPDGTLLSEADRMARRGVSFGKPGVDGMSPMTALLTPMARALLDPIFADLAQPGMCNPEDPESPWRAEGIDLETLKAAARRDNRSAAQRQHDALVAFLRPEMGPANLGQHRGLPVSTIITMSLAEVEAAAGVATTATGGTVPLEEALVLAQQAKPYLAIFDHHGRPLHLGHTKKHRLANSAQRMALIAAERGCTRPGCNAPATLCAVHHVTDFAKGGPTDIENLTLACDSCHSLIGEGPTKWQTVVMPTDSEHAGRIGWIAPTSIDPTRTPQVNEIHHAGELMAASLTKIRERSRPRWRAA